MWRMVLIEEENIGGNKLQNVGVKIHGWTRGMMGRVPVRRPRPAAAGGHGAHRDNNNNRDLVDTSQRLSGRDTVGRVTLEGWDGRRNENQYILSASGWVGSLRLGSRFDPPCVN
jgi:hypothetical protein